MVRPQALFATPPVKDFADSGALYATSNQICVTPRRNATPGSLCAPLGSPEGLDARTSMDNTYGAGEADETESTDREAERQYQEYKREKLWAKEERQKRARRVEEQRQRREADGTEITDQEQKEADDAEDDYYSSDPQWAMIRRRHEAIRKLVEQARQESGMHGNESLVYVVAAAGIIPILGRVIIKNNKGEVAYIMSNEGHPTQWVSVNPDMGTRDGGSYTLASMCRTHSEYKTTTQSTQDIDALTEHSKPRARPKSWDAGPPPADTVPRKLRPVRAYKSRSPKEISAFVDFIMARPDLAVDAPQGLAQRSGVSTNLTKMFDSDWQTFLATLSSYMGENARDILADFDATYIRSPGDGGPHTPHTHTPHAHTRRMPGKR